MDLWTSLVQIVDHDLNVHKYGLLVLNLNDPRFFVHAVESGGFAAAGRRLGCPKSTVSKRVAELETALGVRLVQRTSRSFVLTDVGEKFYEHARATMIEAEAAESFARSRLAEPSGIVNVTASVPNAQFRLADRLPLLAQRYPKIQIRLHVTDRLVDLVRDVAVRRLRVGGDRLIRVEVKLRDERRILTPSQTSNFVICWRSDPKRSVSTARTSRCVWCSTRACGCPRC